MYRTLARYYDDFMTADYGRWINYAASFGLCGRGYDLGCGTGKFTVGLIKRGLDVTGIDISPEMLDRAAENARNEGVRAQFVLADMTRFRPASRADFVTVMCDGVNYVKNAQSFFEVIYDALRPGGTLIFDISSEYKLKNILAGHTFSEGNDEVEYIWKNALNTRNNSIESQLIFYIKRGDGFERREESQVMYVHRAGDILAKLEAAGFIGVRAYGNMTRRSYKETDERIHFIAKKGA